MQFLTRRRTSQPRRFRLASVVCLGKKGNRVSAATSCSRTFCHVGGVQFQLRPEQVRSTRRLDIPQIGSGRRLAEVKRDIATLLQQPRHIFPGAEENFRRNLAEFIKGRRQVPSPIPFLLAAASMCSLLSAPTRSPISRWLRRPTEAREIGAEGGWAPIGGDIMLQFRPGGGNPLPYWPSLSCCDRHLFIGLFRFLGESPV